MNVNVVVLAGRIAAPVETQARPDGSRLIRCLIVTSTDGPPPRIDVLPVSIVDSPEIEVAPPGTSLWVVGSLRRRFSEGEGKGSRLELVAHTAELQENAELV